MAEQERQDVTGQSGCEQKIELSEARKKGATGSGFAVVEESRKGGTAREAAAAACLQR